MRESGYYRVKRKGVWIISEYAEGWDSWFLAGKENEYSDSDFEEIDENRINPEPIPTGEISDGYHTFNELYEFRKMYNAALFNEWAQQKEETGILLSKNPPIMEFKTKYDVHKSWRHNDGELCFGGGWFIVVAILPSGQISNHYKAEDWDLFKIPEVEKAKYHFDGHTSKDVLGRLKNLTK